MFKETVPAIIVSDFDSETENVIYNPSKYQEPKPNKLKIVLPPVYEETNDVELEEQKTFSDGEAEIRKMKNKIINKFNLNPVKVYIFTKLSFSFDYLDHHRAEEL